MIAATDRLLNMSNDNTIFIPGHGPLSGKKDLTAYKNMLVTVRTRVANGIKQGKTLDQIIATDPAKEYKAVFDKGWFIRTVYDSLKKEYR
jgi:cyclase